MIVELYAIKEFSYPNLQFYTVKLGGARVSEYKDFVSRMMAIEQNKVELSELQKMIQNMGACPEGAESRFFKKEAFADRILQHTPVSYNPHSPDPKNYGLRLFCNRMSDNIVVLLNGDRKTFHKVQDCPNCSAHFESANNISKALDEAKHMKHVVLDGVNIDLAEDFELHI